MDEKVEEFMIQKLGYTIPENLSIPNDTIKLARIRVMLEELSETVEAMHENNIVNIADGLGDLLYTVLGTFLVYGIPVREVFNEIHKSNMTKDSLDKRTGKGGKGKGFKPPNLAKVIGCL